MSSERILLKKSHTASDKVAACRDKLHEHTSKPKSASGFDGPPVSLVGTTTWQGSDGAPVSVYYDTSLGQPGLDVATSILGRMDALMAYCDNVFAVHGKSGNIIIAALDGATDGSTGAYHASCSFNADGSGSDWYEDYAASNPDEVFGLVMAEVCESYMGLQAKGWNCGGSGGEGLSRFLAEIVSGGSSGALAAYASGPSWDGTDWISKDQGSDGDYPSIGCSILYCWWMTSLGYTVDQIVQAGCSDGSLASNYAAVTSKSKDQAFSDFTAAVSAAGGATSDNPWNAPTPPYPSSGSPTPPPSHTCPPGQYWDDASQSCVPDVPTPPPSGSESTLTLSGTDAAGVYILVPVSTHSEMKAAAQKLNIPLWQLIAKIVAAILSALGGAAPPTVPPSAYKKT